MEAIRRTQTNDQTKYWHSSADGNLASEIKSITEEEIGNWEVT